jgi:DNA-binding FrmR family transcriptional regulator
MRALSRFEVKMALNYIITDERQKCANKLEDAMRRINGDLDGVVQSIKSVNGQIELVQQIKKDD